MGTPSSGTERLLAIRAGSPVSQVITVRDAINVWATLPELEVRAQLRQGRTAASKLIANLHDYMTWNYVGDDLLIDWVMTGDMTRDLYDLDWGYLKTGFFNVVVSDVGTIDSRALTVPTITLKIEGTTTTAVGDV